eukprot:801065-Rhodomonas_salina.1
MTLLGWDEFALPRFVEPLRALARSHMLMVCASSSQRATRGVSRASSPECTAQGLRLSVEGRGVGVSASGVAG